jgi:hypothetical protein
MIDRMISAEWRCRIRLESAEATTNLLPLPL